MALIGVLLLVLTPSFGLYQPSLVMRERELVVGTRITTIINEGAHIKERCRTRRGVGRGGILMIIEQVVVMAVGSFFFCIRWCCVLSKYRYMVHVVAVVLQEL